MTDDKEKKFYFLKVLGWYFCERGFRSNPTWSIFSFATFHLFIFFWHQNVITHFRLSDAQHSTHAPSISRGMKTWFATAQQSSLVLCSWKTCISQCQEFNILTSLYFPLLLYNSKPDYHHNALTAGISLSAGCISFLDDSAYKEPLEGKKKKKILLLSTKFPFQGGKQKNCRNGINFQISAKAILWIVISD